jgi:hypothetical protein
VTPYVWRARANTRPSLRPCQCGSVSAKPEQFEAIRSETPANLIELNTRWLARAAKAFDVPIVVSTVGRLGPAHPDAARNPRRAGRDRADRPVVNALV